MSRVTVGRVTGLPSFTFHGASFRVQVKVFDWSDAPPSSPWRNDPTTFSVHALPRSANKNTSFSRGDMLYHGTDFRTAWGIVRRWAGEQPLPAELAKHDRGEATEPSQEGGTT
jgi:hypothetical protein